MERVGPQFTQLPFQMPCPPACQLSEEVLRGELVLVDLPLPGAALPQDQARGGVGWGEGARGVAAVLCEKAGSCFELDSWPAVLVARQGAPAGLQGGSGLHPSPPLSSPLTFPHPPHPHRPDLPASALSGALLS